MIEEFLEWEKVCKQEIEHIHSILSQKMSTEPEELILALEDAEAWNARALTLLAHANNWLDKGKAHFMPVKNDSQSETDRKLAMDSNVAPFRFVRDRIEGLCDSIKQRLILGESILAYQRQFQEHKQKNINPY